MQTSTKHTDSTQHCSPIFIQSWNEVYVLSYQCPISLCYYLRQEGYVFARVCLSLSKTYGRIFLKFSENVGNSKNYKWFNFGGNLVGILDSGSNWWQILFLVRIKMNNYVRLCHHFKHCLLAKLISSPPTTTLIVPIRQLIGGFGRPTFNTAISESSSCPLHLR